MPGKFTDTDVQQNNRRKRMRRRIAFAVISRWLIALAVVAIILLNLFTHVLQIVRYSGTGMEPELSGSQTLILRKTQEVEQGDVVAFYYNNQILVRRIISEGGHQVLISEDGTVTVDSHTLQEDYVERKTVGQCNLEFPYIVPTNSYFVMGDNRVTAMDSRLKEIGCVPRDRIIGKVIFTL